MSRKTLYQKKDDPFDPVVGRGFTKQVSGSWLWRREA